MIELDEALEAAEVAVEIATTVSDDEDDFTIAKDKIQIAEDILVGKLLVGAKGMSSEEILMKRPPTEQEFEAAEKRLDAVDKTMTDYLEFKIAKLNKEIALLRVKLAKERKKNGQ